MEVQLNSVNYAISPIEGERYMIREAIPPFVTGVQDNGQQHIADVSTYTARIFPNFSLGAGRNRIDSDSSENPDEYRTFWDSTADTRWGGGVFLGILNEESSGEPTGCSLVASVEFAGDLWTLWNEDNDGAAIDDIKARKYTGSTNTWATGGDIATEDAAGDGIRGFDIANDGFSLLALVNEVNPGVTPSGAYVIFRSTDGASWTAGANFGGPNALEATKRQSTTYPLHGGLISQQRVLGEVAVAIWDSTGGQIELYSTTDQGATMTSEIQIQSDGGPTGIAVYPGIDGTDKLYLGTPAGLYEIDTSPATWTFALIYPMSYDVDNCRRMVVHQGALWFPHGNDNTYAPHITRLTIPSTGVRVFESVGLDEGDGIPDEAAGQVNWMQSVQDFLYMGVGGATGRYGRIWCHNGNGWHTVYRHATISKPLSWMFVSSGDDSKQRLHFAEGFQANDGVHPTGFLANVSVNPHSGATIKRQTSSYVDVPYIDGGFPGEHKAFLRHRIHAKDLSATTGGEYIAINHGIVTDLATETPRTTTDAGDILSGTRTLDINSGLGVSGLCMGTRLILNRDAGDNTQSPVLKDYEVDYYVQVPKPQRFTFLVDIRATANKTSLSPEAVITNLESARDSVPLLPFKYANLSANVRVSDIDFTERWGATGDSGFSPDTSSVRVGFAKVVVEEVFG